MIHLDTQVAIWLYSRKPHRIPTKVRQIIARERALLSPMVVLECELLMERGRIPDSGAALLDGLGEEIGLRLSTAPFPTVVEQARAFAWTRDPFDRLIVANAMADGARLVTADGLILEHFPGAVWASN